MAEKRSNYSEYCDSDSCGSSCCSESDSETPYYPWFENVGTKGELFYVEHDFSQEYYQDSYHPDSENLHQFKIEKPHSKLKPAEKLKKWMKKRKRKVRKSFPVLKSKNDDSENCSVSPDTFSLHSFREIFIDVDSSRQNFGRRFSLSEELFGLELGALKENNNSFMDGKIRVLGIVPGLDISDIRVGDWLRSINDVNVTINNLDDILRGLSLPSKVKLLVSSPCDKDSVGYSCNPCDESLFELFCNSGVVPKIKSELLNIPHGIFHLAIEDNSSANEGVVFKYPEEETPLFLLKGMFVTLSHMIADVCSPPLLSCSITIQNELVHVAFVKEGSETFVLALPSKCSTVSEVQYLVTILVKLLKFQFSSLKEAFVPENYENQLEKFLTIFFKHYLSDYPFQKNQPSSHVLDILPSAHWLPVPSDLKMEIDDILSELESSDYGSSSDGFDGNQRIYSILGSTLYYKGYLLGNHLPKHHFLDVHSFLYFNYILTMTRTNPASEIIIWKEVYPTSFQESPTQDSEFEETRGRYFMLIVSMNHCVLSTLLEAGGCSIKAVGHPPPEPFYVEEVQNTLIILHDCGIINEVEKAMDHSLPPIASPYVFLKESSLMKNAISSILSNTKDTLSLSGNTKHSGLLPNFSSSKFEKGSADGESDVDSCHSDSSVDNINRSLRSYSISAGSTTESQGSGEYPNSQGNNSKRTISSSELSNLHFELENSSIENSFSLVTGSGNTLFQYLHMDPVEGVFLAPTIDIANLDGSVVEKIHQNFLNCCLKMRTIFAKSLRNEKIIKSAVTKYGVNSFLCNMYEQGILFHYYIKDGKKLKHTLSFWVIGRLIFGPEPRELYVCYHDSTEQDVVEIAFRLGFGLSL